MSAAPDDEGFGRLDRRAYFAREKRIFHASGPVSHISMMMKAACRTRPQLNRLESRHRLVAATSHTVMLIRARIRLSYLPPPREVPSTSSLKCQMILADSRFIHTRDIDELC